MCDCKAQTENIIKHFAGRRPKISQFAKPTRRKRPILLEFPFGTGIANNNPESEILNLEFDELFRTKT